MVGRVLRVNPHGAIVLEEGETVVRKGFFDYDAEDRSALVLRQQMARILQYDPQYESCGGRMSGQQ